MNGCTHPLDSIDVEALASGGDPAVSPGAASHAASCPDCAGRVRQAEGFQALLGAAGGIPEPPRDLADRVLRVRPFSRRELRSLAVWRAPLLLLGGLTAAGVSLVAGPVAGAREQIGLAAAAFASLSGLLRASLRWALDFTRSTPPALEALSHIAPSSLGWAALLLLLPAGLGLRAVLARANSRR